MTVAVLFGGKSCEHEVSIITACQAMAAMEEYHVLPIYITQEGKWLFHRAFDTVGGVKSAANRARARVVHFEPDDAHLYEGRRRLAKVEAILVATHGVHGEDGMIAAIADAAGIPCAGCPLCAAGLSMDKAVTKLAVKGLGLETVRYAVLDAERADAFEEAIAEAKLTYPVVVKPNLLGSSIGIAMAHDREGLKAALDVAFCYDRRVLIEAGVVDRAEYNCAALRADGRVTVSEIEQVGGIDEVLSFADKYLREGKVKGMDNTARRVPAEIPAALAEEIAAATEKLYVALGCRGTVRVDFLYDTRKKTLCVNEINSIPGSLAYYLFPALGMSGVVRAILDEAVADFREREKLTYRYRAPAHAK